MMQQHMMYAVYVMFVLICDIVRESYRSMLDEYKAANMLVAQGRERIQNCCLAYPVGVGT